MSATDVAATIGSIAFDQPDAAALFERLGLDYCCGGNRTLEEACTQRGLDAATVGVMLDALGGETATGRPEGHDLRGASIDELCDHIVTRHHGPLHADLDRISHLLATVTRVHGETHQELFDLERLFGGLRGELEHHLNLEEESLFPACRELDVAGAAPAFGDDLLELLEDAHSSTGDALSTLRELSHGYRPEAALCSTHRLLLDALHAFEVDMHQHVHEENNVLFPRVRERLAARV